jgi:hypothetical protein
MKKLYFSFAALLVAGLSYGQSFTNASDDLPGDLHSGGCVGVTDMDMNGYDDVIVLHDSKELHILYQDEMGNFTDINYGSVSGNSQWGMAAGDIDNNGHVDVFCGGSYDGVHLMMIYEPGVYDLLSLEEGSMFMQGANVADINNDGWLDAFGCHDDGESRIWGNDGTGNLDPANDWIDMATTPVSDNSGNYGSVWTDFDRDGDIDLFIAKCRQFVNDPYDPRRINALFSNDGDNNYSEHANERGLVFYEQSWTSDFADIDNDGDFDCFITNHSTTLKIFENNGMGYFTDITVGSGLELNGFFLQAKFADFDNDGYQDLVYAGGLEALYHNNGDNTFTEVPNAFPYNDTMHSFGIGDLNHDGSLDLYASYGDGYVNSDPGNPDILWTNNGNDNNFITFQLTGTESNINAIGAKVIIYGDFGVQIREVRAGESYGIVNCFATHFGLGDNESVDYAVVEWPSGIMTLIDNPEVNTFIAVEESDCTGVDATVVATSVALCEGETATLSFEAIPSNWVWSTGEMGSELVVDSEGSYHAVVWDSEGCPSYTNSVYVDFAQPVVPTISIDGELEFCEGGSVELISSGGVAYEWSNGQETQAVTITEAGEYFVEVTDACDTPTMSAVVSVSTLASPNNPTVDDVTIDVPGTATFIGNSETLRWYDAVDAEEPLATGMEFTTPWIEYDTPYWVEDVTVHGGEEATGGKTENGDGQYHFNADYWLNFDANEDLTIQTVKVYADGAGMREIAVTDDLGAVVSSGIFDVPDGESYVEINLFVPAGTDYALRSMDDEPQMWRDASDDDLGYPYDLDGLASITSSSVQGDNWNNYYYFFYDWTVKAIETECVSDRIEVMVDVVGLEEIDEISNLQIFPNPVSDQLTVSFEMIQAAEVSVNLLNQLGQTILSQQVQPVVGANNRIEWNVSNLAAGLYMVEFVVDGQAITQKVIVE